MLRLPEPHSKVWHWFIAACQTRSPLWGPIIKAQAMKFHQVLYSDPFEPSDSWLSWWKECHGVTEIHLCGEAQSGTSKQQLPSFWSVSPCCVCVTPLLACNWEGSHKYRSPKHFHQSTQSTCQWSRATLLTPGWQRPSLRNYSTRSENSTETWHFQSIMHEWFKAEAKYCQFAGENYDEIL